jgi:hypothetical protein
MTKVSEPIPPKREILVVGPYGVLGTGVLDAAAADPACGSQQQLDGRHRPIVLLPQIVTSLSTSWIAKGRSGPSLNSVV